MVVCPARFPPIPPVPPIALRRIVPLELFNLTSVVPPGYPLAAGFPLALPDPPAPILIYSGTVWLKFAAIKPPPPPPPPPMPFGEDQKS